MTSLYQIITLIFIVENVTLGIVRWFHMCHPYDQSHYPARKTYSWLCFSCIFLSCTIINPEQDFAWLYGTLFWSFHIPLVLSEIVLSYFHLKNNCSKIRKALYYLGEAVMVAGFALVLTNNANLPQEILKDSLVVIGVLSSVAIIHLVIRIVQLKAIRQQYLLENYSNEDDFPVRKANIIFLLIFILTLVTVTTCVFSYSPLSYSICLVLIIILSPVVLIYFLHPHVNLKLEVVGIDEVTEKDDVDPAVKFSSSAVLESQEDEFEKMKRLDEKLRHLIIDEKIYLNPHLTLADLAKMVGSNRTSVSQIIQEHGGFYNVMNRNRLKYADEYQVSHPKAKVEEIAIESGFGSKRTYQRIKNEKC